jgi:stress-induced morphogen
VHVVSDAFTGKVSNLDADSLVALPTDNPQTTLQRHRMIYTALSDELEQGVHALSLKTKTVQESANTA